MRKYWRYCWLALAVSLLVHKAVMAQEPEPAPDPERVRQKWAQMSAEDFINSVVSSRPVRTKWPKSQNSDYQQAVYQEAARRVLSADAEFTGVAERSETLLAWASNGLTKEQLEDLVSDWLFERDAVAKLPADGVDRLIVLAKPFLSPEELAQVREHMDSLLPEMGQITLEQLFDHKRRTAHATARTYEDIRQRRKLMADWVRAHDLEKLTTKELEQLFYGGLRPYVSGMKEMKGEWTAQLTVPRTGEYFFDITPLTISTRYADEAYEQACTVTIDGQQVVRATAANWQELRQGITLTANRPIVVRMEFSNKASKGATRYAAAQLFWKGPGISHQIVPASVYTQPGSDDPGVDCVVIWKDMKNQEQRDQAVLPSIDQFFLNNSISTEGKPYEDVLNSLFERYMADEHFHPPVVDPDQPKPSKPFVHPFVYGSQKNRYLLIHASGPQRQAFANKLLQHPEAYRNASHGGMFALHSCLQPGAHREALDVLGNWMELHRDMLPRLAITPQQFFSRNRSRFMYANIPLLWQHAESFEWLEQDYLETEDGSCCLPVAYILAYGYQKQGKILDWIGILDERIASNEVTGDAKVNWLIARAMAEEVRRSPADRHQHIVADVSAGMEFIQEAMLVARSPEAKTRTAGERIARLAALGNVQSAKQLAQEYPAAYENVADSFEQLQQQADTAAEAIATRAAAQQIRMLEGRARSAEARGDSARSAEFEQAIERLQQEMDE